MSEAVEVRDLVVRYGSVTAAKSMTFCASQGQVTAVVGPNGAGKTTTVETCEGFKRPDAGTVRVLGLDPIADAAKLKPRVGVMLQSGGVPSGARPLEALRHMASLYRNPLDANALAERLELTAVKATYRRMSGGEQQRLKFAIALIGRPELVFLDEPTAGLDVGAKHSIWELVAQLRSAGVSIVLTTHLMDDVERLADKIVVVSAGQVVAAATPEQLVGSNSDLVTFSGPMGLDLVAIQQSLPTGSAVSEPAPGSYLITGNVTPQTLAELTAWCAREGVMARDLATGRRRLEDVIVELTTAEQIAQ